MHFYLLQTLPTLKESDTSSIVVAVTVFVFFVLFLVIAGKSGGSGSGSIGTDKKPSKFSKRKFKHHASSRGLAHGEIQLLEKMIKRYKIQSPYGLLNNSPVLDKALKKALDEINESPMHPDEQEAQKLTLYRIKQKIERSTRNVKAPESSRSLRTGQKVTISVDNIRYQSKVTSNLQKSFSIEVPKDNRGSEIRWKKWTRVEIYFWRQNGQSFSFESKILGYNMIKGISSLFLQHSHSIKEAQQRKYRRKSIERSAYFYPIRIITEGVGKNTSRKAIVNNRRGTLATILDISAGGCAMRSSYPLERGELLKIEFETEGRQKVVVFGKVVGMTRMRPTGGLMHVMFTRISRTNMNKINSYIYSFENRQERKIPRL